MKRRRLITLLGSVLACAVSGVRAEPVRKPARIGMLSSTSAEASGNNHAVFKSALRELGWVDQRDVIYVHRYAHGDYSRFETLAAELAGEKVDLIFAGDGYAAKRVARVVPGLPVVFALSADPVGAGIVASLARPGKNVTGLSTMNAELAAKRVQLLTEIRLHAKRIAILSGTGIAAATLAQAELAARNLGLQIQLVQIERAEQIDSALDSIARWQADAMLVVATSLLVNERQQVVRGVARLRLPTIYSSPDFVSAGGLMSYSVDFADNYRRSASYVDKILRGAVPASLPVEQPTKFELVINVKTARALGLTIPQSVLLRADRVIE